MNRDIRVRLGPAHFGFPEPATTASLYNIFVGASHVVRGFFPLPSRLFPVREYPPGRMP